MNTQHYSSERQGLGRIDEEARGAEGGLPDTRTRIRSVKGLEYDIDLKKKALTQARRTLLNKLQDLHKCQPDCRDPEDLRFKISHTEDLLNGYQQAFDVLATLVDPQEQRKLEEALQAVQVQWKGTKESVLDQIQKLEREDVSSRHSQSIVASKRSFGSTSSARNKRLDAQAKAAALRSKMEIQEEIIKHKTLMAEQEAQLARLQIKQELAEAEAEAVVYERAEDEEESSFRPNPIPQLPQETKQQTLDRLLTPDSQEDERGLDPNVPPFAPSRKVILPGAPLPPSSPAYPDLQNTSRALIEAVSLQKLPTLTPKIFKGEELEFLRWESSFDALVGSAFIDARTKLHYLCQFLDGEPLKMVEHYQDLHADSETAYLRARKELRYRYGNPSVLTTSLDKKLSQWPKIGREHYRDLLKFSDFLNQVTTAMRKYVDLKVFDSSREIVKLSTKLPGWAQNHWRKVVWKYKVDYGENSFPPFTIFADTVETLARQANMPEFEKPALGDETDPERRSNQNTRRRTSSSNRTFTLTRTFSTNVAPKLQQQPRSQSLGTQNKPSHPKACQYCRKNDHKLIECPDFMKVEFESRKNFLREQRICFNCLASSDHVAKKCDQAKPECATCEQRHATALHDPERHPSEPRATTQCTQVCGSSQVSTSCAKIVLVWLRHPRTPGKEVLTYALLDDQSNAVLMKESVYERLGLQGTDANIRISTVMERDRLVACHRVKGLEVSDYHHQTTIPISTVYTRDDLPADKTDIPTRHAARQWPHLRPIADHIPKHHAVEIGLLIGRNVPKAMKIREVINGEDDQPWAERYDLGWTIIGNVCTGNKNQNGGAFKVNRIMIHDSVTTKEVSPCAVQRMMELDYNERRPCRGGDTVHSIEDKKFLETLEHGIHKDSDGCWEMPLPFREGSTPTLPDNRSQCLKRLLSLKRKFEKEPKLFRDYFEFMDKIISKGHASKVAENQLNTEPGKKWYLPHFPVYHPRKPDQVRVVFDCSATFEEESLNKHLLQGPDLTNKLIGVLNRFRQEEIAFMCDVEQMFHSFKVNEEHRNFIRFLWFENGHLSNPIVTYRMNVHLFGAASSPGCSNFGLQQTAREGEVKYGKQASRFLQDNFYVDDGLKAVKSPQEAINLIKNSQAMCAEAGLHLHKFTSNSLEVLEAFPPEDRAKDLRDLDLRHDVLPIQRSLGTYWCIESDSFQFRITLKDKPLTRRGILSTVSSVYDPLGFVSPVILVGKLILRELCKRNADWDDPVPQEIRPSWERWREDLSHLEQLQIARCFKPPGFGEVKSTEIHSFADASELALGQVSYLRLVDEKGDVHVSFLMGKARVAPLKVMTIPRLELTAAVVSVNVAQNLIQESDYHIDADIYYSDSTVVIGYINSEARRFHVYVGNRIQQIRDRTAPESWHHVKSHDNPADVASRSATAKELLQCQLWLKGPEFLWQTELPKYEDQSVEPVDQEDPELKKVTVLSTQLKPEKYLDPTIFDRFSSWYKLKKAVAIAILYVRLCRQKFLRCAATPVIDVPALSPLTTLRVEDLNQAEHAILRSVQHHHFREEMSVLQAMNGGEFVDRTSAKARNQKMKQASALYKLDPFLDQDGVLRVGGRIRRAELAFEEKHPAILPKQSHVTTLVIRNYHEDVQHQGRMMTLNEIRQHGYWIIHGRTTVSNLIAKCVTCRRLRTPLGTQKMSDLPVDRLSEAPPFTYAGVDVFGPWYIKERRKTLKRYGLLFTCMASRAIHLETLNTMETDSFICALRRFINRRGRVRQLRSDCGTNFIGAKRELSEAWKEMNQSKIQEFLLTKSCDWVEFRMNVPHASHMGGVWERQIKSVRSVLTSLLEDLGTQLDDESLRTLFTEAENIVNSRPLTSDLSSPDNPGPPISPMQLLTLKAKVVLPPPGNFTRLDVYSRKRWRRVQFLANQFWNRWRQDYLQTLQTRPKWQSPQRSLQVGDIVIVKDENAARNHWKLARVNQLYPDDDGHIRKVQVRMASSDMDNKGRRKSDSSLLDRPIHKLVLLVETPEEAEDS